MHIDHPPPLWETGKDNILSTSSLSLHRFNIPDVKPEAPAEENVENDKGGVRHVWGNGQIAADNNTIRLEPIN